MSEDGLLSALRQRIGKLPGVWHWRKRAYARRFAALEHVNLYLGVYASFEDAQRSAPPTKPVGYDNESAAGLYTGMDAPQPNDAPAINALQRALQDGCRSVFDLGGHTGVKFYAFRSVMDFPADLRWEVCDVPAVVERGRAIAAERSVHGRLSFTTEPAHLAAADVLFASGSIQYLPRPLTALLAGATKRPRRVIVHKAALHPSRSFFTLNSIGVSFCPYRVQAEPEFRGEMEALGYRCTERWVSPREFRVPFEPAYDFDGYVGLAFER